MFENAATIVAEIDRKVKSGTKEKFSCFKTVDEVVVDWFTWSRFLKRASSERIKAKNVS